MNGPSSTAQLNAVREAVTSKFAGCVRPLYVTRAPMALKHFASGILLEIGRRRFLVTAAHVSDAVPKGADLWVAGERKVVPLGSQWLCTSSVPPTGRDDDKIDLAYYVLPDKFAEDLGQVTWIRPCDMAPNDQASMSKCYVALGYPNSKNTRIDHKGGLVYAKKQLFLGRALEYLEATGLGVQEETHVVMPYRKRGILDERGRRSNPVKLNGMSGGAVVSVTYADMMLPPAQRSPKLVGVIIEMSKDRQLIVATRISLLQAMMLDVFPEFASNFEPNRRVAFSVTPASPAVQGLLRSTV